MEVGCPISEPYLSIAHIDINTYLCLLFGPLFFFLNLTALKCTVTYIILLILSSHPPSDVYLRNFQCIALPLFI